MRTTWWPRCARCWRTTFDERRASRVRHRRRAHHRSWTSEPVRGPLPRSRCGGRAHEFSAARARPHPASPARSRRRGPAIGVAGRSWGRAPDVIVVDSYAATPGFLGSLRATAQIVAVDDMADRPLPVDVVVNGGAG